MLSVQGPLPLLGVFSRRIVACDDVLATDAVCTDGASCPEPASFIVHLQRRLLAPLHQRTATRKSATRCARTMCVRTTLSATRLQPRSTNRATTLRSCGCRATLRSTSSAVSTTSASSRSMATASTSTSHRVSSWWGCGTRFRIDGTRLAVTCLYLLLSLHRQSVVPAALYQADRLRRARREIRTRPSSDPSAWVPGRQGGHHGG
jgi:hypothetical protein